MTFSSELVSKYQKYMLRVHKVEIPDSQAQLDLKSLSNLYLLFTESNEEYVQRQSSRLPSQ